MSDVDRIEEILKTLMSDPSPEVRKAASEAFDAVRARRSAPGFMQELRTGSVEERISVVYSAGLIGGQEGIGLLLAAMADPEAEVRAVAARELSGHATVPVLKAIVDRLPKEKGVVLANMLETLGKSRRRELAPVVERYLSDADPEVKGKAIVAYARTAEAPWALLLQNARSSSETVRAAVARGLGEWSTGAIPQ